MSKPIRDLRSLGCRLAVLLAPLLIGLVATRFLPDAGIGALGAFILLSLAPAIALALLAASVGLNRLSIHWGATGSIVALWGLAVYLHRESNGAPLDWPVVVGIVLFLLGVSDAIAFAVSLASKDGR